MEIVKLPRSFAGAFNVLDNKFTVEAPRFIVHTDRISFELEGVDDTGGAFTVTAIAARTKKGTYKCKGIVPEYRTSAARYPCSIEFTVVEIVPSNDGIEENDQCRVEAVWTDNYGGWYFSGFLGVFEPESLSPV